MTLSRYPHKDTLPIQRFVYWIAERENIRRKKEGNGHMPYTKDPILHKYRFCNCHREDDRVTRWIATHWRDDNPLCWHAMIVARFINWPPTLEYCGYPEPWKDQGHGRRGQFVNKLHALEEHGAKIFTGAYIVSTNGAVGSKVNHVIRLFDRAWREIPYQNGIPKGTTLEEVYKTLRSVNGIGSFMAAQVVADLKYVKPLKNASDWMDFVAPGPGSQRGLNRLLGRELHTKWNNKNFQKALIDVRKEAAKLLPMVGEMHLQDLQNILCESDKYERVLTGAGRPRSQYRPTPEPLL